MKNFKLIIQKNILYILLTLFSQNNSVAQEFQDYHNYQNNLPEDKITATPEVMAFHKISFLPTDLYTGRVNVTIPIFEIKIGSITVPITLTYNTGGIKVDEEATNVGTGWNLNAGGNILRIIKDIEDHTLNFDIGYKSDPKGGLVSGGYQWDLDNIETDGHFVTKKGFLKTYQDFTIKYKSPTYKEHAKEDALPDLFLISAPGISSKFYFQKINNKYEANIIYGPGIKIKPTDHKLVPFNSLKNDIGFDLFKVFPAGCIKHFYDHDPNFETKYFNELVSKEFKDYDKFEIISENGNLYKFSDYDIIENVSDNNYMCDLTSTDIIGKGITSLYDLYSIKKSSWYLNEIIDPLEKGNVKFIYEATINNENITKNNVIYKSYLNTDNLEMEKGSYYNWIKKHKFKEKLYDNPSITAIDYLSTNISKITKEQRIKEIVWKEGKIIFLYNLKRNDRNSNALTDIIIQNKNNNKIKHFKLNYSYFFTKENCSEKNCQRLKLESIDLLDNNMLNKERQYSFKYDESSPLPKIRSLEQDFLGYYNNNGMKITRYEMPISNSSITTYAPSKINMYFYPNKGSFSLLPFNLKNITDNYAQYDGDVSLEANSHSLLGLLKEIKYPTGGSVEFEYENHKFNLFDNEITAGGARIKKQKIKDNQGNYRIFSYEYKLDNGITSGYINNIPKYADLQSWAFREAFCDECYEYDWLDGCTEKCFPEDKSLSLYIYNTSRAEIELTNGSFVGYSNVIEKEEGNGYKKYFYSSPLEFPNEREEILSQKNIFFAKNSHYPGIAFVDNDIRRRKLLKEEVYDENNILLQQTKNTYNYKLFDEKIFQYRESFIYNPDFRFNQPLYDSFTEDFKIKLRTERNLLTKKETKEYFNNGTILSTVKYEYDSYYPLLKKEIKNTSTGELITQYQYPPDLSSDNSLMQELTVQNQIATPVTTEVRKVENSTEKQLSFSRTEYAKDASTSQLILPKFVYSKKGEANAEKKITYDRYDTYGNLLQYTPENALPVSIIWGYNQTYPIAKIEGATYNQIENRIKNLQKLSDEANSSGLLDAFAQLRAQFPDTRITSYTYQPLVGITSITAPNSLTEYYSYDLMGRLMQIKDSEGNLLKSFEYNYKSQN